MTSCVANWLTRTFRCSIDDSNRGPRVRRLRFAPPCLETLEGRDLPSDAGSVWNFVSARQLHPMKVNVLSLQPGASLNPIFVAPYDQSTNPSELVGDTGPLIMDGSGNPIWFDPLSSRNREQAIDFEAQTLFGRPVLTWWQGTISGIKASKLPAGTSLPGGHFVIYNEHYREIMSVQAPKGFSMDEHEFLITPQGDAYFIATKVVKANLTPYGGRRNGEYVDPEVFEVNLRTKKLIFTWNMAAHVPLRDAVVPMITTPGRAWDPYHANSIDVSPDGSQILVSAPTRGGSMTSAAIRGGSSGSSGASRTSSVCRPT